MPSVSKPGPVISPSEASSAPEPPSSELVVLLALLLDAQDADVADVVVAAGVDAAGDLDLQLADLRPGAAANRSAMCCAIGIERALASAQ